MDRCLPSDALSSFPVPGRWRTLEYDADDFSGVMLLGGPETAAPDITYELGVTGWHAVSVGVFPHYYEGSEVLVRLSKEDTFSMLRRVGGEMTVHELTIHPLFWRIVDLTDQDLVFGQISYELSGGGGIGSVESPGAQIAYVKLVPLTDVEVGAYKADRAAAKKQAALRAQRRPRRPLHIQADDRRAHPPAHRAVQGYRLRQAVLGGGWRRPAPVPWSYGEAFDLRRPGGLRPPGLPQARRELEDL